jgi:SPP1 gp7 family putative phage head morphogenesis protein
MPMDAELTPLPPEQAIAYFRQKGFSFSWDWHQMWHEDHARAFTVAKAMRLDILQDIRAAVDKAIVDGTTFERFKDDLIPALQQKGWWGRQVVDGQSVQLGSAYRLRTIFNVNVQTAYQVGHHRAMTDPDVVRSRPFWRYVAVNDGRTRPQHKTWHNTVLPHDHEWWSTHYPPNGWNCRCTVVSASAREMERDGLKVTENPDNRQVVKIDPRTGDAAVFPAGIDPGWDYNPGKAWQPNLEAHLADKINAAATVVQSAVVGDLASSGRFAAWVDEVLARGQATGQMQVVGVIDDDVRRFLAQKGIELQASVIVIDDKGLLHAIRDAKKARSAALPLGELAFLPQRIETSQRFWDKDDPAIVYAFDVTDRFGKVGKAVVRVNYKVKKIVTNRVVTVGVISPEDLVASRYEKISSGR